MAPVGEGVAGSSRPRGSAVTPPGEDLPDTGGPNLWILLAGLGLVGAGTAVTLRTRRKAPAA